MGLSLMKERVRQSGCSLRDEQVRDGNDALSYGFMDDVTYNGGIVDYVTGLPVPIKMYDQRYSAAYGFTSKFITYSGVDIPLGKLLHDVKHGKYWLCVESYNVSDIHNEGKLGLCGRFLKWQDDKGDIKEIPIIVTSASKYNNGEDGTPIIILGSDQLMLYTQLNEDTAKLDRGMKFFIDENKGNPSVYELTRPDTALYSYMGVGFLSLIVTERPYSPTEEELRLGVCNYHEPPSGTGQARPDETAVLSAAISGNTKLKVGYSRKYAVEFFERDGSRVSCDKVGFEWDVSGCNGVTASCCGNVAELFVDDEALIGTSFLLSVKVDGAVAASVEIEIVKGW